MNKNIIVIDSGIGGTSLLESLLKFGLAADFYYQSDSKNVPYGGKKQAFMFERMKLMLDQYPHADAAIIACNTLTAETIEEVRQHYSYPIFGIEPYVNYLNHSDAEKIALILTPATFGATRFKDLLEKKDPARKIDIYPLDRLALLIENYQNLDWLQIENELLPLKDKGYTHLILGCTHYPLITKFIESKLGLQCIDPTDSVIDHVIKTLNLSRGKGKAYYRFNIDEQESLEVRLPLVKYE